MLSVLSNTSDFNIDANSVLTDLDRSLRSQAIGDQCEAIVRVPRLFERYPFPILINSASLKLSEVYRNGTNFLRILILQVMKESEKHLDKILNIDEFVRHLFAVSYSNDPLARSITLRTLAHIARIVSNNKNIHHFIRNSLDSNDELEVDAAIEASVRFAVESKEFAQNIYPKVISMIEGLITPIKIKIRLLEVINNLHHNFVIAEDARKKLISFLVKYPGKRFVCEDLHTLTSIAAASVTHISDQVKLLLEYYVKDPRNIVKLSVLKDLKLLAHESAHLWEKDSIIEFVDIIFVNFSQNNSFFAQIVLECNAKELKLLCEALGVLSELLGSPSIFIDNSLFSSEHIYKIINFSTQIIHQAAVHCSISDRVQILLVSKCFTILTNICLHANSEFNQTSNILQETCCAFEAYFLSKFNSNMNNKESRAALQTIFRCLVVLCRTKESNSGEIIQITEALRFIFLKAKPNSSWYEMICETICSLALVIRENKSLNAGDILEMMRARYGQSKKRSLHKNGSIAIKIFVIYFQLKTGQFFNEDETKTLLNILSGCDLWVCYKIVREAMRFGHHSFASQLLAHIKSSMEPIENTYFWINSLERISHAESFLSQNDAPTVKDQTFLTMPSYEDQKLEQKLSLVISAYIEGFTHLKASVSTTNPMRFQCEFIKLRMKFLQAHQHFRQCCKLLQSSPPPTSATLGHSMSTFGTNSSDDFLKCGRIVFSMRKCAQEFRSIAENYSSLYQSSFNADPNTLSNIQLLQHSCTILAEVIENLFQGSHRINSLFVPSRSNNMADVKNNSIYHEYNIVDKQYTVIEHKELEDVCTMISDLVRNDQLMSLSNIDGKTKSDGNNFLSVFTNQVEMLLRISARILLVSLSFPRFYFQAIQWTNIKLELSPQTDHKSHQDLIQINQSVQFVLNVEGVVINGASNHSMSNQKSMMPFINMACPYSAFSIPTTNTGLNNDTKVIRNVNKILLTLNAIQVPSNSPNDINNSINSSPVLSMHSVVQPLNDYFQTQFLLSFTNLGFYHITVETSIIDENEAQWKTGPIQTIIAKVIEDNNK